ncbi:MAG TPA: hypothetical protein EYP40_09920 [Chromatiales bacterium]|nr:hypothetical protein [Chromatiales bacterium]
MWEPQIDADSSLEQEFLGALARLDRLRSEHRLDDLLARSRHGDLSPDEKQELTLLLGTLKQG